MKRFRMQLFVDVARERVLFARARKDVVAYLHALLTSPDASSLPFASATAAACIGNLYDNLDTFNAAGYLHLAKRFFECGARRGGAGCLQYVTEQRGVACPSCGCEMAAEVMPRGDSGAGASCSSSAGRVDDDDAFWRYVIKDDLAVFPVPASMMVMELIDVDSNHVEKWSVLLGYTEGLAILKASLQGSTALTDVFLRLPW